MGKNSKPKGTALATLKIYWKFMKNYPATIVLAVILLPIATVALSILLPLIYAKAIDDVSSLIGSQQNFMDTFGTLLWQSIILVIIGWVSWRIIGFTTAYFNNKVTRDLDRHIFNHLTNHSYDFHINSFSGSLVSQANRMASAYERLYFALYIELFSLIILIIGTLIVLFPKSPAAALAIVIWIVVFSTIIIFMQIKKIKFSRKAAAASTKTTAAFADAISNMFTVISFGKKLHEQNRFRKVVQKRYLADLNDNIISEYIFAFQVFMMMAIESILIWLTVSLALQGEIGLNDIILVQFYIINILISFWTFGRTIRVIERAFSDAHEMTNILNTDYEVKDPVNPVPVAISSGKIDLQNVVFSYDKNSLFNNFNLTINPGEKIGLVGSSGGGKTTITKLLLRLMDISDGSIKIDGQDIRDIKQDDLRQHIAYVPQEPILFHRTLKENIAYGNEHATDEQIFAAAKDAHATEFIEKLPDKYQTMVGERGVKLSGGQRQRIAIARAILKNAPILLLDEATSALDSESENLIQDALWKLMENRTTIVIAHRLSTIQHMNRILVINNGKIAEQGTHQELSNSNGLYAKLWNHQSGGFITD